MPIPGRENAYEASNLGNIRSIDRTLEHASVPRRVKGRVIKQQITWNGRATVAMRRLDGNGNRQQHLYVHRLVASAWIPNPDDLPEINHIDGNPLNNRIENLEWCTHAENHQHKNRVLGMCNMPKAKLSPAKTVQVMVATGNLGDVASRFGVSRSRVHQIRHGRFLPPSLLT